jgi:hypothetical protein
MICAFDKLIFVVAGSPTVDVCEVMFEPVMLCALTFEAKKVALRDTHCRDTYNVDITSSQVRDCSID